MKNSIAFMLDGKVVEVGFDRTSPLTPTTTVDSLRGLSAWLPVKVAISAVANHEVEPKYSLPATNEVILLSFERLRSVMRERASRQVPA